MSARVWRKKLWSEWYAVNKEKANKRSRDWSKANRARAQEGQRMWRAYVSATSENLDRELEARQRK